MGTCRYAFLYRWLSGSNKFYSKLNYSALAHQFLSKVIFLNRLCLLYKTISQFFGTVCAVGISTGIVITQRFFHDCFNNLIFLRSTQKHFLSKSYITQLLLPSRFSIWRFFYQNGQDNAIWCQFLIQHNFPEERENGTWNKFNIV